MEHFEVNGCFPGEKVNLPRTKSNLFMFMFHNIWVCAFYASVLNYCVKLYGSTLVLSGVAMIAVLSKFYVTDCFMLTAADNAACVMLRV